MRSFIWTVLAAAFLGTAVQAQSTTAVSDAIAASGVNVANVPDCAVSMGRPRSRQQADRGTESMLEQFDTICDRLCSD